MTAANKEPQPNKPEPVDKLSWFDLLDLSKGRPGLRHVGTVAVVGGVLLALIQVNDRLDARTQVWVLIFMGIAVVGALLRIEAAIRDRSRH
ncbi:hypothetical protein [Nonomuraea sp. NPDC050786]|uniref:hypothetical protein n=1 Tax=Nonomuraea sp. NPDC050786 TaxID=3154840 RepID=UPI0033DB764C